LPVPELAEKDCAEAAEMVEAAIAMAIRNRGRFFIVVSCFFKTALAVDQSQICTEGTGDNVREIERTIRRFRKTPGR
jgi:hypothetical protein